MHYEPGPKLVGVTNALLIPGRILFSLSVLGIGIETLVCARTSGQPLGFGWNVVPCWPWLPAISVLAGIFGIVWASCGMGLLAGRGVIAGRILGALLLICTLIGVLPKYLLDPGNLTLRAALFEPLALGAIALLQPGRDLPLLWLERMSRFLLGLSLVVFGLDTFLDLGAVIKRLPGWLPRPERCMEFYAIALVLAGFTVVVGLFHRWAPAALGLLVGIYALMVHLPPVVQSLIFPGVPLDPFAWSDLFFSVALWGGLWTLVRWYPVGKKMTERPVYAGRVTGGTRRHLS